MNGAVSKDQFKTLSHVTKAGHETSDRTLFETSRVRGTLTPLARLPQEHDKWILISTPPLILIS